MLKTPKLSYLTLIDQPYQQYKSVTIGYFECDQIDKFLKVIINKNITWIMASSVMGLLLSLPSPLPG